MVGDSRVQVVVDVDLLVAERVQWVLDRRLLEVDLVIGLRHDAEELYNCRVPVQTLRMEQGMEQQVLIV